MLVKKMSEKNILEKGTGLAFTNLAIQARSTLAIKKWPRKEREIRGQ